jgi:hypothetical protein
MAEELSPANDPAVTERPSRAAGLIIIVGPDPPEARKAATRAPAGHTRSAGGAREPPKDAEGRQAHSQEGDPRDQLNR